MIRSILIIDDEVSIQQSLMGALQDEGYHVTVAGSAKDGIDAIRVNRPDIILLDIWMPDIDGVEALKTIKMEFPNQVILMMSGHGSIETAVKTTKLGAFDFIEKPLSLEKLLILIQNAFSVQELTQETQSFKKQAQKALSLVGESILMKQIKELIQKVAPTTGSVLIIGENGTGKELVAQSLHTLSLRHQKPFIEVNCAAIPEELIESELFGHERGAFTGATQLRRGKFDLAHGGTLFLDEIGDMSLKTQAKILRILQEQKFERVGGTQTIFVDVRIVAATNKDLKIEIQDGKFREDLFYRLNVIPFFVPPLRGRLDDIPLLADYFLKEFSLLHNRCIRFFSEEALCVLKSYSWPGNVRELKNLVERIVILSTENELQKIISAAELLTHLQDDALILRLDRASSNVPYLSAQRNLKDARSEFEKEFILKNLKKNGWNISKTAQILGIERSHLHRKIKNFGIEMEE